MKIYIEYKPIIDQRKIKVKVDWPLPIYVLALIGFLGVTRYCRRFVWDYGLIAKSLTAMLWKYNFASTPEAREAFEELKRAMTKTPILALPNFERLFEVYNDANVEARRVVLVQDEAIGLYLQSTRAYEKGLEYLYPRDVCRGICSEDMAARSTRSQVYYSDRLVGTDTFVTTEDNDN